jgi:tetratricopeptide (TPR) repeat protein
VGKKIVCSLALLASLPVLGGGCASTTSPTPGNQPSLMDKLGKSVKSSGAAVASVFKKKPADPNTMPTTNGKAGPGVFVAMAEISERNEQLDEAEAQYKKALELDANNVAALVGYARLEDRRHNFDAALKLYQQALKKHSRDASVHNDLGLCYHHRDMLPEAAKSFERAVELNQDRKLYRNNLAAVYVDQGKPKEALKQLIVAHGEAVGNYNLAFLLMKKNDNAAALVHFRKAAETDPTFTAAREWIGQLTAPAAPADPKSTRLAMVESPQLPAAPSATQAASAKFTISAGAPDSTPAQTVMQAGGTGDETQYAAAGDRPEAVKVAEVPRPSSRWPNKLREMPSTPQSVGEPVPSENRLPTVAPAKG